jgi:cysteine synthase
VLDGIGSTPVVRVEHLVEPGMAEVWVKLESANPTGSYKDRMALAMIEGAERSGRLAPGQTVVEYTGGSTGSSLALVCAVKGYPLRIVSSDAFSPEKLRTMRALGASVELLPSPEGITPTLVPRMMERAAEIVDEAGAFATDQFRNRDMLDGYEPYPLEAWRGRGIYKATVAYRAGLAAERGFRLLEVDASNDSRPILERLGFVPVTTTTPFIWSPG